MLSRLFAQLSVGPKHIVEFTIKRNKQVLQELPYVKKSFEFALKVLYFLCLDNKASECFRLH